MSSRDKNFYRPALWWGLGVGIASFVTSIASGWGVTGSLISALCGGAFAALLCVRLLTLDERPRRKPKHVDLGDG